MGPSSYMLSVIDRNVVMRHMTVVIVQCDTQKTKGPQCVN
jgi:hypothetical protein